MGDKIGIIGAGPAGILASGIAGSRGKDVTLIEKNNKIGRKLFITGKGRCNITNAISIDEFFEYITKNREFLYSSLYSFSNLDIVRLLKEFNLDTKVERGNRVFPKTDKSSDVIKAFSSFLEKNNVKILPNSEVFNIDFKNNKFLIDVGSNVLSFDKLILATGGKSYPATGSTGDGYIFAQRFGHKIIPIKPSLVPMEITESWVRELQGLSLKNIELKAYIDNKLIHTEFGELVFTHYGISGPIVLTTSSYLNGYGLEKSELRIDLKPALDASQLDNRILRDFQKNPNRWLKNSLNDLLPQRIIPYIIALSGLNPDCIIHQITKEDRKKLGYTIKNLPFHFKKFRPIEEAIITSGGVSVEEINPSTMESKIFPNLYFAGELIDVDALTGGFNLQIAYSTGYLAGMNV